MKINFINAWISYSIPDHPGYWDQYWIEKGYKDMWHDWWLNEKGLL